MSMTDPLGDMLTRIRNGLHARKDTILAPASKNRERLLAVLEREGYIRGFEHKDLERGKAELIVAKQRNGPTGKVHLAFLRQFTRFENLLRHPPEEE